MLLLQYQVKKSDFDFHEKLFIKSDCSRYWFFAMKLWNFFHCEVAHSDLLGVIEFC